MPPWLHDRLCQQITNLTPAIYNTAVDVRLHVAIDSNYATPGGLQLKKVFISLSLFDDLLA